MNTPLALGELCIFHGERRAWDGPVLNDLRYAIRMLRQNPGFAFTAIVSTAVGIGANTTTFGSTSEWLSERTVLG